MREVQETLQLSDAELAWVVDVDQRTVLRWHQNQNFPQGKNRQGLDTLQDILRRVDEAFADPDAAKMWLNTPNHYLGELTPRDALLARRSDRVVGALEAMASGFLI